MISWHCIKVDARNGPAWKAILLALERAIDTGIANTVYTVKVTGNVSNASFGSPPFTISNWSFTTQATNAIPDSSFIAPDLSTTPSQPIDGLNATNQAILTAQYACQQYELSNPSATADCNWLANPLVAAGNQSGAATATASTTMTAGN